MLHVVQGSLSRRTYEVLRSALIIGTFRPGERLLIQDLAKRLGTSITPVREACLRLVSEQALELQSGRFVMVPSLTRERYWQIRLIRIALEGLATELAVGNASEPEIEMLESTHSAFVAAENLGSRDEARRLNQEFHFGVYRLCKLPILLSQIENMWVAMGPIFNVYYNRPHQGYAGAGEHIRLLDAMRRKDASGARKAIERDIERGGMILLQYFDDEERTAQIA
jgi:DNA-binding GntR family transcriptional regulator